MVGDFTLTGKEVNRLKQTLSKEVVVNSDLKLTISPTMSEVRAWNASIGFAANCVSAS